MLSVNYFKLSCELRHCRGVFKEIGLLFNKYALRKLIAFSLWQELQAKLIVILQGVSSAISKRNVPHKNSLVHICFNRIVSVHDSFSKAINA